MWGRGLAFLLGVVVAPLAKPLVRPLLREVIRGGILLSHEDQKLTAEIREDVEDLVAEATAERPESELPKDQVPS